MDPQIAGLAALYAVIELVKFFVLKYHKTRSGLGEEERYWLANLHEKQKLITKDLADHFRSTEETAFNVEAIIITLERIERRMNSK